MDEDNARPCQIYLQTTADEYKLNQRPLGILSDTAVDD
jgi:hypothetical protein